MYNDKIKVANKIVSYDVLYDVFSKMNEKLMSYKKISYNEEMQNKMLDYGYQKWTFKDNGSKLTFNVDFYDDTNIKFDNFNNFITIFNSRLDEIKSIWVYFSLSYSVSSPGVRTEYYSQHINMYIYENKMDIDISISSEDRKIDDIYELIKNKISSAPVKYDDVIKSKSKITSIVDLAIGFIPALLISVILLFIPSIRYIFAASYVLYPICCLFMAFFIGGIISSSKIDNLYKSIVPDKKYVGYDSNKGKSIYKDDIDKYVETSEILIGKNADNLKCRNEIMESYNKYKKYVPYEVVIMLIMSIIVLFF